MSFAETTHVASILLIVMDGERARDKVLVHL